MEHKLQRLRYCPLCNKESKKKYGWYYWHRVHQVRWIHVCPEHQIPLLESPIAIIPSSNEKGYRFYMADGTTAPTGSAQAYKSEIYPHLTNIAQDGSYLLTRQGNDAFDITDIVKEYKVLLGERNLIQTQRQNVDSTELTERMNNHYPAEFLALLNSELTQGKISWIQHFFRHLDRILSPSRHLLLMHYLGFRAEEFIEYIHSKRKDIPNDSAIHQPALNILANPDRKQKFKLLWEDENISLSEIERRLRIDRKKIRMEAIRLGLSPYRSEQDKVIFEKQRHEKRKKWLSAMKKHPSLDLAQLLKKTKRHLYKWLRGYDYEWLEMTMTQQKGSQWKKQGSYSRSGRKKRLDWHIVDQKIAKSIPNAVLALTNQEGRPVFATRSNILRYIDKLGFYNTHRKKLPRTIEALAKYEETRKHFALRKIRWALGFCSQHRIHCCKSLLFDRLKLTGFEDDVDVMAAFEDTLDTLTKIEQEYYRTHLRNYEYNLDKGFGPIISWIEKNQ
jgi:hypothetical protein